MQKLLQLAFFIGLASILVPSSEAFISCGSLTCYGYDAYCCGTFLDLCCYSSTTNYYTYYYVSGGLGILFWLCVIILIIIRIRRRRQMQQMRFVQVGGTTAHPYNPNCPNTYGNSNAYSNPNFTQSSTAIPPPPGYSKY